MSDEIKVKVPLNCWKFFFKVLGLFLPFHFFTCEKQTDALKHLVAVQRCEGHVQEQSVEYSL